MRKLIELSILTFLTGIPGLGSAIPFQVSGFDPCEGEYTAVTNPDTLAGRLMVDAIDEAAVLGFTRREPLSDEKDQVGMRLRYTNRVLPGNFGGTRRVMLVDTSVRFSHQGPFASENLFRGDEQVLLNMFGRDNAFDLGLFGYETIDGQRVLVFYEPDTMELNGLAAELRRHGFHVPMEFFDAPSAAVEGGPYALILAFLGWHPKAFQGNEGPHELFFHLPAWLYPPEIFALSQGHARAVIAFNQFLTRSAGLPPMVENRSGASIDVRLDIFSGGLAFPLASPEFRELLYPDQGMYRELGLSAAKTTEYGMSSAQFLRNVVSSNLLSGSGDALFRAYEEFSLLWASQDPSYNQSILSLYPNAQELSPLREFNWWAFVSHTIMARPDFPHVESLARFYQRVIEERQAEFQRVIRLIIEERRARQAG